MYDVYVMLFTLNKLNIYVYIIILIFNWWGDCKWGDHHNVSDAMSMVGRVK